MSLKAPATLRLIADQCGVSMTTVSKILRGKYKGNTPKGKKSVEAVTDLARKMGYIANGSARRLRDGRHRAIVVVVPVDPSGHPAFFTFEYITGIASILSRERYSLALATYPSMQPDLAIGRLSDRNFDGAIVLEESGQELDRFLSAAAIPTIYVNVEQQRGRRTLCRDERAAGRSLVELLYAIGYRRMYVVGGTPRVGGHFSLTDRHAGIREAIESTGMAMTGNDIEVWESGFDESILNAKLSPDTVVVSLGSAATLRLMRCIPRGQPIACCDDAHIFINIAPGLTRATFDRTSMGRAAAESILARIDDPAAVPRYDTFRPGIHLGSSTPPLAPRQPAPAT